MLLKANKKLAYKSQKNLFYLFDLHASRVKQKAEIFQRLTAGTVLTR